ncbi:SubName: Full=Uncharacterized protein {ECO:0000313/EMBL:CCA67645.1} [Serendipita indica DSM 11827]|nr:SubName: Full=Uncharacterized protein {ECO:0000313/EMBL:CCA67645.1} [Serendipita indica DSM 11827]
MSCLLRMYAGSLFSQLIDAKGKIQVCMRWETTSTSITAAQRTAVEEAVGKMYNKWIAWLAGWDDSSVQLRSVTVVGWVTSNTALLQGSTSGVDVYNTVDEGGIPQCDPRCGRFFHQDHNYSSCPGGSARHYDWSLWLTQGMSGGAGGDWGMRIGLEYMMQNLNSENIHILLHEMGHHFALDDFYDWTPTGMINFIMLAGSSTAITPFDGWMARDWWRHLKSRYNLSAATSTTKASSTSTSRASSSSTRSSSSSTRASSTTSGASSGQTLYGQCGGQGWTGPTTCAQGTCKYSNAWYSQCLN